MNSRIIYTLIISSLLPSIALAISALDFFPKENRDFNQVFLKRQIDWSADRFIPTLSNNSSFQEHLSSFINKNSASIYLSDTSSDVRFFNYFIRAKTSKGVAREFELALLNAVGPGSLWNKNGRLKNIEFIRNNGKNKAPLPCQGLKTKIKPAYFEFNLEFNTCTAVSFKSLKGHPFYLVEIQHISEKKSTSFFQSKVFYPGVVANGGTNIQKVLMDNWRLGLSRVYNGPKYSIIYFP